MSHIAIVHNMYDEINKILKLTKRLHIILKSNAL